MTALQERRLHTLEHKSYKCFEISKEPETPIGLIMVSVFLPLSMAIALLFSMSDERKQTETALRAEKIADYTRRTRCYMGRWPTSLDELQDHDGSYVASDTNLIQDAWGHPFEYVPMDPARGYGSVISPGGKGFLRTFLLWRKQKCEWRFTWPHALIEEDYR